MKEKFQELITNLSQLPAISTAVATATCPQSPQQIISKLLDMDVPVAVLTRALAEVFDYPVYHQDSHGKFTCFCKQGRWGYASGILFVTCPFDSSLQPAVLLPSDAYQDFTRFGLLPINGKQEDPDADNYDRVQAGKVIRRWLSHAVAQSATDLHITPLTTKYIRVRTRVDGQLRTLDEIPINGEETNYKFISNMLLKMMNCATGSFIRPIDGRFEYQTGQRSIEVRVSMRPVNVQGMASQSFYLRLLGVRDAGSLKSFATLGFSAHIQDVFADVRRLNQGLVLITGPTGSGKSTTLYANLARIVSDASWRSIQTLEDPVELDIQGIDQTQINEDVGMGFQDGLKALMRSDVDVILVGEIRDPETARLAVRASLTGHLVFATVHAKDALSAIERMLDLGVAIKSLALVLSMVFAQRLVRRVCPYCSTEVVFSECDQQDRYFDLFSLSDKLKEACLDGCASCEQGYRGRRLVIEYIRINRRLAQAIAAEENITMLEKIIAHEDGETLWCNAASLIRLGETTLAECERHLSFRYKPVLQNDKNTTRFSQQVAPATIYNHV